MLDRHWRLREMTRRPLIAFMGALGAAVCGVEQNNAKAMPPVSAPPAAIHTPPRAILPVQGGECCSIGAGCNGASVVVRVDSKGQVSRIRVEGSTDPTFIACVERGIRSTRFVSARLDDETPVGADWTYDLNEVRDSHPSGGTPLPKNGRSPE